MTRRSTTKPSPAAGDSERPMALGALLEAIAQGVKPLETLHRLVDLYNHHIAGSDVRKTLDTVAALDRCRFLEKHAWGLGTEALGAKTDPPMRHAWLLTILHLVNYRLRSSPTIWTSLLEDGGAWSTFVEALMAAAHSDSARVGGADAGPRQRQDAWTIREKTVLLQFLAHCYERLDLEAVATPFLKLVSLGTWTALSETQRELEWAHHPRLQRHWNKAIAPRLGADESTPEPVAKRQRTKAKTPSTTSGPHDLGLFVALVDDFTSFLGAIPAPQVTALRTEDVDERLRHVAVMLVLLTNLLAQLPTRRFLHAVLRRRHVRTRLRQSPFVNFALTQRSSTDIAALSAQLVAFEEMLAFPIDAHSGATLASATQHIEATTLPLQDLQLAAFATAQTEAAALEPLAIAPTAALRDPEQFRGLLDAVVRAGARPALEQLAFRRGVFRDHAEVEALTDGDVVACIVDAFATSTAAPPQSLSQPLLPTEMELWRPDLDPATVSAVYGTAPDSHLFPIWPVPRLGLQYLTVGDFVARAHALTRLATATTIRRELEAVIPPLDAVRSLVGHGETVFRGVAPRAAPLATALEIQAVSAPAIGDSAPARVLVQFDVELALQDPSTTAAWADTYRAGEVVYLVTIRPTVDEAAEAVGFRGDKASTDEPFAETYGVLYVRCAEVVEVEDENRRGLCHPGSAATRGRRRTFTVALDGKQYKSDLESDQLGAYEYVNLVVRQDPEGWPFKSTLDALKDAAQSPGVGTKLPTWLDDLFLGYGDPAAATATAIAKTRLQAQVKTPLVHVCQSTEHAVECLSDKNKIPTSEVAGEKSGMAVLPSGLVPAFTVISDVGTKTQTLEIHRSGKQTAPTKHPKLSRAQVQAIVRGSSEGATLVVGPSGSIRSQTVARLVENIHLISPLKDKMLIVVRTNEALRSLVDALTALETIDAPSITALRASTTSHDPFSPEDRVSVLLQRRLDMLAQVDAMAKWLEIVDPATYTGVSTSASYSCENALYFYRFHFAHVLDEVTSRKKEDFLAVRLAGYYKNVYGAEPPSHDELATLAKSLESVYTVLDRLQSLELLQTSPQRRAIYLTQHARIIITTTAELAQCHQELTGLRLAWGGLLIDDAEQQQEIETFLALRLAATSTTPVASFKHLILVGDRPGETRHAADHDEEPWKSYGRLDMSLFARWLRLGVPHIELSASK